MHELSPPQFPLARSLFNPLPQFVIPQAVLSGHNPGRIFMNDLTFLRAAFLWTPCGYWFIAGNPEDSASRQALRRLLFSELVPQALARGENGFLLIPSDPGWSAILHDRQVIPIYRRIHRFDPARFASFRAHLPGLPAGMSLQKLTSENAPLYPAILEEIRMTWGSLESYTAHGYGFVLLQGNEPVSSCISVFASETTDEISVHTEEKYQRQGWATVTAACFITECLTRGRTPNWECFWENEPSVKLAQKLGFVMVEDYPVWYWEET
jgi:RimJ/RimL family protein N-acetyltransferase